MIVKPYLGGQPTDDFGQGTASIKYDTLLALSTEQTLTVPGDAAKYKAVMKFGGNVWVSINATATEPGAAFATTDSELNPTCREVKAGDVLHFIAGTANTEVSVALYAA
jgi:hypothetical protein